jgi:hypothetical protein
LAAAAHHAIRSTEMIERIHHRAANVMNGLRVLLPLYG